MDNDKPKKNREMTADEIVSVISGVTQEEAKQGIERNKEFIKKIRELHECIMHTSENNKEVVSRICTVITALLQPCPPEERLKILEIVGVMSLSGKSDELLDSIKKFSG